VAGWGISLSPMYVENEEGGTYHDIYICARRAGSYVVDESYLFVQRCPLNCNPEVDGELGVAIGVATG